MKTCKHWDEYRHQQCSLPEWLDNSNEVPTDGIGCVARADDDQGLDVVIYTGPDFGCIKHKEKKVVVG